MAWWKTLANDSNSANEAKTVSRGAWIVVLAESFVIQLEYEPSCGPTMTLSALEMSDLLAVG